MWEQVLDCFYDLLRLGCIAGAVFHEWVLPWVTVRSHVRLQDDTPTTPDYAHRGQKRAFPGRRVYLGMGWTLRRILEDENTSRRPFLPRQRPPKT